MNLHQSSATFAVASLLLSAYTEPTDSFQVRPLSTKSAKTLPSQSRVVLTRLETQVENQARPSVAKGSGLSKINAVVMSMRDPSQSCLDHKGRPIVVITGQGAITPLANNAVQTCEKLVVGESGIQKITRFDTDAIPVKVAGEVKEFSSSEYVSDRATRKNMGQTAFLAVAAADEALQDAQLLSLDEFGNPVRGLPEKEGCPETRVTQNLNPERVGTFVGSCMGETEAIVAGAKQLNNKNRVPPRTNILALNNMPNWAVNARYGLQGEGFAPSGACATSNHAIGVGMRAIRLGELDLALVGAADHSVTPYNVASYVAANALEPGFEDAPEKACQPWNADRRGFVISDGSAVLVLERLDHALARGIKKSEIHAVVEGYGASSDAYHPTKPRKDGSGGSLAQLKALEDANLTPKDIGLVCAHATGTPLGDYLELQGLDATWKKFGTDIRENKTPIFAPKSVIGHTLGASGGISVISAIHAMKHGIVPPTMNFQRFDEFGSKFEDINLVPNEPQPLQNTKYAMINSLGFGGTNAVVILRRYDA